MAKKLITRKRACREIVDDMTIDKAMEFNYKRPTLSMKCPLRLNAKHQEMLRYIQDETTNMVFVDGPAGTAKTYIAVYGALQLLKMEKVDEIIYIRSIIESASKSMGSLPGELNDKFQPYTMPLIDKLSEILPPMEIQPLFDTQMIRTVPVNFTRGLTFTKSCVIIDESQNLTEKELVTILTRFGNKSTYIICGDSFQNDIKDTGFRNIKNKFDTSKARHNNIYCCNFDKSDIVRSAILKFIVDVLEN